MPGTERQKSSGSAKATIDHDEIRHWVEEHGGHPATVKRTARGKDPGLLRIDFPGYSGEGTLKPISWDEFFRKFDASGLAFLYQDRTRTGRPSRFNKLVKRETATAGRRSSSRAGTAEPESGTRRGPARARRASKAPQRGARRSRKSRTAGASKRSRTGRKGPKRTKRAG